MCEVFGEDGKRIDHALRVFRYASAIAEKEGADLEIVDAASILHDIGIREAEKKHQSNAGKFQEMEGPGIAEPILNELGYDDQKKDAILDIIANHHSAKGRDCLEFRCVWDADWLVNIPDDHPDSPPEILKRKFSGIFRTSHGRILAETRLFSREN